MSWICGQCSAQTDRDSHAKLESRVDRQRPPTSIAGSIFTTIANSGRPCLAGVREREVIGLGKAIGMVGDPSYHHSMIVFAASEALSRPKFDPRPPGQLNGTPVLSSSVQMPLRRWDFGRCLRDDA